ncbi:MAG TPA: N-acetylmuramoyl-L-alanine amidase [Opitutaceae bacterium]|nr:N-acetylmuramoyl-L-alanine amidase [Opitutaceae bacterium]
MAAKSLAHLMAALAILTMARMAPPAAAETAKVGGLYYVDAAAFGERYGLAARWLEADKRLLLQKGETRVEFEVNLRDMIFDGRRTFMGSPAVYRERSLWISLIDAERLLRPLLRLGLDRPPPVHTIVIDPGHGIPDDGAENKHLGLKERALTLDTAVRLKKILEDRGYHVVLTRTTDKAISPDKKLDLRMRDDLAVRLKADLFISIHFNFFDVAAVHGTETFRFTPRYQIPLERSTHHAEDDEANPSDKNTEWNTVLGYCIHRALLGDLGSYDRGLRHNKLAVLRFAPCPAVLVESGYITNDAEARKIATPAYRQQIAEGIAAGIRAYVNLGPAAAPPPVSPPPATTPSAPAAR